MPINRQARWTDVMTDELEALHARGYKPTAIGRQLGVSRSAIIGKLWRLGLAAMDQPGRPRKPVIEAAVRVAPPAPQPAPPAVVVPAPLPSPSPSPAASSQRRLACSLIELTPHTCRWPIGDPQRSDFCFCGDTPTRWSPYCREHAMMAYGSGYR